MTLTVTMDQRYVIDTIGVLKKQLEYYLENEMKYCYMDTLNNLKTAEKTLIDFQNYFSSGIDSIPVIDFYKLSSDAQLEISTKKEKEDIENKTRHQEYIIQSRKEYDIARKTARTDLEKKYMLAFMTQGVPSTMKDTDMIKALKRVPQISEEARLKTRMLELDGLF